MYAENNYISLSFHADDGDALETDMSVEINLENADDAKLAKRLNAWLRAIEANLKVVTK